LSVRELWSYPLSDPSWVSKALFGGLLLLLAPLFLPLLLVLGYLVALVRLPLGSDEGGRALPGWRPWGQRLADGARLLAAMLLYGWPALFLFGTVVVGPLVIEGPLTDSALGQVLAWAAMTVQPVGLIWLLVGALLFPLLLRQAAGWTGWRRALSPVSLWALLRANLQALPAVWAKSFALLGLSLLGFLIALVGFPFTLFWTLLGVARLASQLNSLPE